MGQFPNAPAALLVSAEADLFPLHHPELADLIDGSIGEGSPFHEFYGYYAQGVGERTAVLPERVSRLKETDVPTELRKLIEARIRRDSARAAK